MREARLRDVGDRAAAFARAHTEIDVFESVDERFVETARVEKPLRSHGHRRAGHAERVARSRDAGKRRRKIAARIVPMRVGQHDESRALRDAVFEEERAAGDRHVGHDRTPRTSGVSASPIG